MEQVLIAKPAACYELITPREISRSFSRSEIELFQSLHSEMRQSEIIAALKNFHQTVSDGATYLWSIFEIAFEHRYARPLNGLSSLAADPLGKTMDIVFSLEGCEPKAYCFIEIETEFGIFFVGIETNKTTGFITMSSGYVPLNKKGQALHISVLKCMGYEEARTDAPL